ncbi:MAG TPA: bifunctional phosphopantothenoylcysteine decarboxylase/phosphopantothenate--cysteine ligase CoaBC [Actinobacteria bacterium]|nr:bifunctional phosphopantothenoylcysteine decarboxylase/phosphopantothenate--cysteine ligase CoaBC [Actinomycetota bacterium]
MNRRLVVGVTGGIAAYKTAHLVRLLTGRGHEVRTMMTRAATRFLGPQTLAALTGSPPVVEFFDADDPSPHTELARWADGIVVAPATTATLARLAAGLTEDVVSATVSAFEGPVVVAPAMHTAMWEHPATRRNVALLEGYGYRIVGPAAGALAGGDEGVGRMAEPDEIAEVVERAVGPGDLAGWRVLVDAGGTREPIDPVRYLGNRSSGKMGIAIARQAARRGADVVLVTTVDPGVLPPGVEVVRVETSEEMAAAVWRRAPEVDVAVLAAAVADFRPTRRASEKIPRSGGLEAIELEATPDILRGVAELPARPFLVGFAAETGDLARAKAKAAAKGVDLLVANDVTAPGSGFGTDTNEVTLIFPDGSTEDWPLLPKDEVAARLWDRIVTLRSSEGRR